MLKTKTKIYKTVKTAYKAGTSNPAKLCTVRQFTKLKFDHSTDNALAGV
jgi:hypothetical protein